MDTQISSAANKKMFNGKIVWSGGPSQKQYFSLPESIIYYISKNPSTSECYSKMIQTCKYFFEKLPLLVVADIYCDSKICSDKDCNGFNLKKCCVKIDLNKISSKFWFTNGLYLHDNDTQHFASMLCSKIYRCDFDILSLNKQNLMYDDFKFLASSATYINFGNVQIKNHNGSTVMLEKILEAIPNLEKLDCFFKNEFSVVTVATVKIISNLTNLGNLTELILWNIPELFNLEDFSTFIKNRSDIKFRFEFAENISEGYKAQLDALVDTVIESGILDRYIWYPGQDEDKRKIMAERSQW